MRLPPKKETLIDMLNDAEYAKLIFLNEVFCNGIHVTIIFCFEITQI